MAYIFAMTCIKVGECMTESLATKLIEEWKSQIRDGVDIDPTAPSNQAWAMLDNLTFDSLGES